MLRLVMVGVLAAAVLAGCGKGEGDKGSSGGSSSGGGSGGGAAASAKTPEQFFEAMKSAMTGGDGEALWAMFSAGSKKWFVEQMKQMQESAKKVPADNLPRMAEAYGVTVEDLKSGDPEKLAKAMLTKQCKDPKEQEKARKTTWVKADIQGDKAICETKDENGTEWVALVKEGGEWKFDVEESGKLDKEKKGDK